MARFEGLPVCGVIVTPVKHDAEEPGHSRVHAVTHKHPALIRIHACVARVLAWIAVVHALPVSLSASPSCSSAHLKRLGAMSAVTAERRRASCLYAFGCRRASQRGRRSNSCFQFFRWHQRLKNLATGRALGNEFDYREMFGW